MQRFKVLATPVKQQTAMHVKKKKCQKKTNKPF